MASHEQCPILRDRVYALRTPHPPFRAGSLMRLNEVVSAADSEGAWVLSMMDAESGDQVKPLVYVLSHNLTEVGKGFRGTLKGELTEEGLEAMLRIKERSVEEKLAYYERVLARLSQTHRYEIAIAGEEVSQELYSEALRQRALDLLPFAETLRLRMEAVQKAIDGDSEGNRLLTDGVSDAILRYMHKIHYRMNYIEDLFGLPDPDSAWSEMLLNLGEGWIKPAHLPKKEG